MRSWASQACLLSKMLCRQLKRFCNNRERIELTARFATQTDIKIDKINEKAESFKVLLENAKPYEEIPGPSALEVVRVFLPGGVLYKKSAFDMMYWLNDTYGDIVRLRGVFGKPDTIATFNPDDYPVLYRNEGTWPERRGFDAMVYFRRVHRRDYFQGVEGLIASNGETWAKLRSMVNPVLMNPKNAKLYLYNMLEVNDEFLARIREIRDNNTHEMPATFHEDIKRLTLETVCAVALNTQLGLLRKNRDSLEAQTIITSLKRVFDLSFLLDIQPSIWKIIKTPKFKEMMRLLDTLLDVCNKYINEALVRIEHDAKYQLTSEIGKEKSVLEKLVRLDKKLAVIMALDMLMAGVDTTSTALAGILLCIAKNPEKQLKLLKELQEIMPQKNTALSIDSMHNLPYLRACIKEGLRMYPVALGTLRRTPYDIVLSGFRIPKGIDVATGGNLQLVKDSRFLPQPEKFLPERWLHNNDEVEKLNGGFMYLPFGIGSRICVGKRIVDLEMEITIARLVRNFNIEFNYSTENAFTGMFLNVPNIPLKFKFEERLQ